MCDNSKCFSQSEMFLCLIHVFCKLVAHDGDYWRLLVKGKYGVAVCAPPKYGCQTKEVTVVNPYHQEAQIVNFELPLAGVSDNSVENEEQQVIKGPYHLF